MSLGPRSQILWNTLKLWVRTAWTYTLGHPFTYDLLAAAAAFVACELHWFRWWLPAGLLAFLLARNLLLRREVRRLTH